MQFDWLYYLIVLLQRVYPLIDNDHWSIIGSLFEFSRNKLCGWIPQNAHLKITSSSNWTRTQNHLVLKRTLNHLAKLAILLHLFYSIGFKFCSSLHKVKIPPKWILEAQKKESLKWTSYLPKFTKIFLQFIFCRFSLKSTYEYFFGSLFWFLNEFWTYCTYSTKIYSPKNFSYFKTEICFIKLEQTTTKYRDSPWSKSWFLNWFRFYEILKKKKSEEKNKKQHCTDVVNVLGELF